MIFEVHRPPARLGNRIKLIWTLRGSGHVAGAEPIVPDGCPEIVLNFADRFSHRPSDGPATIQPATLLVGQMTRAVTIAPLGRIDLLGIRFWPAGAASALRVPMHRLRNAILDAGTQLGPRIEAWRERLGNTAANTRIELLFRLLSAWLPDGDRALYAPVRHAVSLIEAGQGRLPVERVASAAGMSRRNLERLFQHHVGLTPKELSRIVRVQQALRLRRGSPTLRGAALAALAGYADQAHLIRDFQALVGHSPGAGSPHGALGSALQVDLTAPDPAR